MVSTQAVGHCRHCKWQWVIPGDTAVHGRLRASRRDMTKPAGLKCPECGSGNVRIEKEINVEPA